MKRRLALLLALTLGGALAQTADRYQDGFTLPSGRLQCQFSQDPSYGSEVRCDVLDPTFHAPAPPADCPLAWGDSLYVAPTGRAAFTCHGDTVMAVRPVLDYGQTWRRAGITCASSRAGVRCTNTQGHGFTLARAHYDLF